MSAGDVDDDEATPFACQWCAGDGCKSCGYTGYRLDAVTGEPITRLTDLDDD